MSDSKLNDLPSASVSGKAEKDDRASVRMSLRTAENQGARRPMRLSVDKGAYMCELRKGHSGPCGSLPTYQGHGKC